MKRLIYILIPLAFVSLSAFIVDNETTNYLFKIERSKDNNQIFYTVNTDAAGKLKEKPITVFWIKNTKKGRVEPLTWIQKKYAYGLSYKHCCEDCATFQFVSYDKLNFLLKKEEKEYKVYTKKENKILEVQRIFVQIDGGTFWLPNVTEIKLYAQELKSGKEIVETIIP